MSDGWWQREEEREEQERRDLWRWRHNQPQTDGEADRTTRRSENAMAVKYDEEEVCECGHGTEEHSYAGCDAYTPTWPRLVRCSCNRFPGTATATP